MAAKKRRKFGVSASMTVDVTINIVAESLEDALAQARTLKELDFIEVKGDFNDSRDFEIRSVWS